MSTPSNSLIAAVYDRNETRVRELIAAGANLEERDTDRATPLLLAAQTDQFEIAETLLGAGADIWAITEFGDTVGRAAERSKLLRGPDAEARDRVLAKLRSRGFPFPAEHRSIILRKVEAGEWPPHTPAVAR